MRSNTVLSRAEVSLVMLRAILGSSYAEIAEEFCIGKSTVGDIVKGRTWKDVKSPSKVKNTNFYVMEDGRVFNIKNKNLTPTRVSVDKQTNKKYVMSQLNGKKVKVFI